MEQEIQQRVDSGELPLEALTQAVALAASLRDPRARSVLGEEPAPPPEEVDLELLDPVIDRVERLDLSRPERLRGLNILSRARSLRWLGLGGRKELSEPRLSFLADIPALEGLVLSGTGCDDRALARVPLGRMEQLELRKTRVGDTGLVFLARHARLLRRLDLQATDLSARGVARLAELPELRAVSLYNLPGTGDAAAEALSRLPQLAELDLGYTSITEAGIRTLSRIRSLRVLRLWGLRVEPAALSVLLELPDLFRLELHHAEVSLDGLPDRLVALLESPDRRSRVVRWPRD